MVGGTPKPFACTHEGCTATFATEDHLNVHQKKHEMDLDLTLGNKMFVADQTPTPTRFLRNCEEVGLFQDLQNVNPFEETFRRAVELGKTGSLPEPEINTDDTLHTPHVFPLLTEENIYSTKTCTESTIPTIKICTNENLNINDMRNEEIFEKDKSETTKTLPNKEHDYALDTNKNESKIKNKAKVKLKQAIKNKKNNLRLNANQKQPIETIYLPPVNLTTAILLPNASIIPIQSDVKLIENVECDNAKRKSNLIVSNKKEKLRKKSDKEELLERNRAAASRCRQKKKQWIDTLQKDYDKLMTQNNELQEEIMNLKSENAQLKSLLLAHRDCPITKAMTRSELIPCGFIKVNVKAPLPSKNRLVLPKTEAPQVKIPKLSPSEIPTKNIALLTPVEKSVIVLNKTS